MGRRANRRLDQQAWQEARQLRAELLAGRELMPVEDSAVPIAPTERCFGVVPALFSRHCVTGVAVPEHNVTVVGTAGFVAGMMAIESWSQARRTRDRARPRWRAHEAARAAITDRHLWCHRKRGWLRFDYAAITGFAVDLPNRAVVLSFAEIAPVRLWGPWVPWLSVALVSRIAGAGQLHRPDLHALN